MRWIMVLLIAMGVGLAQHGGHNMAQHTQHNMGMQSMSTLERLSGKNFDIAYMSMMIDHHKGAVEMSEAALKVSKDERIRKAAQEIIAVQNEEIAQLTGWLKSWYQTTPNRLYMQMMRSDMKGMMDKASQAISKGSADRGFLEGMIPHHQDAVDMSGPCVKKAAKPELKAFCQTVIEVQAAEIKQFQEWLKTLN